VFHMLNAQGKVDGLVNSTNNGLERYNRTLNEAFSHPHPSVHQFVRGINDLSQEYVRKIEEVRKQRAKAPNHRTEANIPTVPQSYKDFKPVPVPESKLAKVIAQAKESKP
jgi:hypothetical protein